MLYDYAAARALGKAAVLFYRHEDELHLETLEGNDGQKDSTPT
jgi:hypothetical protein